MNGTLQSWACHVRPHVMWELAEARAELYVTVSITDRRITLHVLPLQGPRYLPSHLRTALIPCLILDEP